MRESRGFEAECVSRLSAVLFPPEQTGMSGIQRSSLMYIIRNHSIGQGLQSLIDIGMYEGFVMFEYKCKVTLHVIMVCIRATSMLQYI